MKRVNGEDIIEKATFESYGCAANIAAASILTEMIIGKSLREAWNITWKKISDELGRLPAIKYQCNILAVRALKRAIRSYYKNINEHPDWPPKELTVNEKQVLEEEMLKRYYSSMRSFIMRK